MMRTLVLEALLLGLLTTFLRPRLLMRARALRAIRLIMFKTTGLLACATASILLLQGARKTRTTAL